MMIRYAKTFTKVCSAWRSRLATFPPYRANPCRLDECPQTKTRHLIAFFILQCERMSVCGVVPYIRLQRLQCRILNGRRQRSKRKSNTFFNMAKSIHQHVFRLNMHISRMNVCSEQHVTKHYKFRDKFAWV